MVAIPHGHRVRRSHVLSAIGSIVILAFLWLRFLSSSPPPPTFDPEYGKLAATNPGSKVAIATFLSGDLDPAHDPYFISARILAYQLLHDPSTRVTGPDNTLPRIPFLTLCTSTVTEYKKAQLAADGATIVDVKDVPLTWWIKTGVTRWRDQFTKLRLFEMTEYERVLFIDADTLLMRPIHPIFTEDAARIPSSTLIDASAGPEGIEEAVSTGKLKADEAPLPSNYIFLARSDNALAGKRNHTFPPARSRTFSAGFWLAAPSKEMYAYLLSTMQHYHRFDPQEMEQSMLNYAFRREGAMPWGELDPRWSATWPNMADVEAGVVSLHEKNWFHGAEVVKQRWWQLKADMEAFFAAAQGAENISGNG